MDGGTAGVCIWYTLLASQVLERQSRSTLEEQGDKRCTAEVHEMNNRGTLEALHRTENT